VGRGHASVVDGNCGGIVRGRADVDGLASFVGELGGFDERGAGGSVDLGDVGDKRGELAQDGAGQPD